MMLKNVNIIEYSCREKNLGRLMEQSFDFSSYNSIKRLPENELNLLWEKYLNDKSDIT